MIKIIDKKLKINFTIFFIFTSASIIFVVHCSLLILNKNQFKLLRKNPFAFITTNEINYLYLH